ncbi:PEP-CTERM sorting domain-containing protein [Geobacter sp. FeAm09]|uniref:PEP-CTERM sorting domain-containing protein n=1 Tax=Geobacter sp. FeAm09 TaxID=2597769 RepID=UPI0011EEF31D|nr:PEP-CTERM sorting domain-containing protein [Geobacter sp. FeAm09]QEM68652.1 PEP-CTERM sorting domain-containing protein [Geobacter sp. FeAm09]
MKRIALVLALIASLAIGQAAHAATYTDTSLNWDTWTATSNNSADPYGSPDIASTTVTMDTSKLLNITFNLNSYNFNIASGDLFIDAGADGTWDYVVRALGTSLNGTYSLGLYAINVALHDTTAYTMSSDGGLPATYYRAGVPVGLATTPSLASLLGYVTYSAGTTAISFDFSSLSDLLLLTSNYIIGYEVTCGNDVIYQEVPVPEPGTMALFGAGILCLVVYGKRRMGKSA